VKAHRPPGEIGAHPSHPVFVVDDDPSVRRALQRLFRSAGYPVEKVASAAEFLAHAAASSA
jgi:FixJ family two-component response regulator